MKQLYMQFSKIMKSSKGLRGYFTLILSDFFFWSGGAEESSMINKKNNTLKWKLCVTETIDVECLGLKK